MIPWRPVAYGVGGLLAVFVAGSAPGGSAAIGTGEPFKNPVLAGALLTQGFGCTALALEPVSLDCPGGHVHQGLDLAAPAGTELRAAAAGRAMVLRDPGGFGTFVVVRHDDHLSTIYGHLSVARVRDGQRVAAGDVIGEVGSSGNSTGPHLHFQVDLDGIPVDPTPYLKEGEAPWSTKS